MAQGKSYKFYGSDISIAQFALGNAITGITNASPAVVTDTAHGLAVGVPTAVKITGVVGMTEINDNVYIAIPIDANTYSLQGVDSINYAIYVSGGDAAYATWVGSCEHVDYSDDTGATPVVEEETVCGITTSFGAPRDGTVSMSFKSADTIFQQLLALSRTTVTDTVIKLQRSKYPKVSFDIGVITQMTESGSAGGTWSGTASLQRTAPRMTMLPA